MREFLRYLCIACCCLVSALAQAREPEAPGFRDLLPAGEFQTRLQAALKEIGNPGKLADSRAPVIGLQIAERYAGGAAEQLDIQPGDVVFRVDSEIVWGGSWKLTGKKRQKLQIYSQRENQVRTEFVSADRLGVDTRYFWRPELAFLRGKQRSKGYDEAMIVAAVFRGRDPDLAESCLAQAVKQGYAPDNLSHQLGLEIALIHNHPEVASQFADLLAPQFETDPTIHPVLILRSALANGQFELAYRVLKHQDRHQDEELDPVSYLAAAEWQRRIVAAQPVPPKSPASLAQEMTVDDLESKLQGAAYHSIKTHIPALLRGDGILLKSQTGGDVHYALLQSPQPCLNFDITTHLRIRADDLAVASAEINSARVSLWASHRPDDLNTNAGFDYILAGIEFQSFHKFGLQFGNFSNRIWLFDSSLQETTGSVHKVRFIRVGPQIEVFLNGHRVLLAPAAEEIKPMDIEFRVSGMTLEVPRVEFKELIKPVSASVTAPK
ncbi:hypothetical protein [Planctomicrobium piriforme]|uniref:PDZ domain-containing protein n=1 Tax=Planctomicrobium piriforme TaxID=1576369 RepID=A0A1I3R561_9PLAN|nr:hypothetical protein [Planctomicrobium piriforme]SFJ41753.1 hypothetical protein SAMN05421753_12017 [Planctomicrobium piriforme]